MQQKNKPKNKIIPQMFDVRPVDNEGNLDLEKMRKIERVSRLDLSLGKKKTIRQKSMPTFYDVRPSTPQEDEARRFHRLIQEEKNITSPKRGAAPVKNFQKDTDISYAIRVKNERAILEQKLEKERRFRLEQEAKLAFLCEQAEKKKETEKQERELLHRQIQEQKKQEKQRQELLLRKIALERKKEQEKSLIRKLRRERFQKKLLVARNLVLRIIFAPFQVPRKILRGIARHFHKFLASIQDFFALFDTKKKKYPVYHGRFFGGKNIFSFFATATCIFCLFFGAAFFYRSLKIKSLTIENGKIAYANLNDATVEIMQRNFDGAIFKFNEAYDRFDIIQKDINSLGSVIVEASRFVPYVSKLSSGEQLSEAGKNISQIGVLATDIMKTLNNIKNPEEGEQISYLKIFQESDRNLTEIALRINDLENNLERINLEDIPEDQRSRFIELKKKIPEINKFVSSFSEEEKILSDVLGGNGQRKYLFLFQNNQEMRATGGFIGTYAVLDIFDGNVKSFFVDGIFNPDGQLREKVIPPAPIQKISAAWSLHDSNWFPDFPMSAEKASWFYEKTGGPTVDGVITMTPTVMQKLLEITGPIEMPEYDTTIDTDNFLENIQYEVEVDYDKELNQPKKILADLAPKILDRIFNVENITDMTKTLDVLLTSLNEKHILIYSKNYNIEKMLSANGWSGEILDTQKDYLSVINTNINGYKTDGVISEKIEHEAEIQTDGSIIDTITITRQHNGGDTPYDWWNKVNADYMRVYVPKGSRLIRASGQTNEFNSPPLDYRTLGFKTDPQVVIEEASMIIDEESGTRIYEDSGKTVFANWVYVSPGESVIMSYSYLLPFKLDTTLTTNPVDTYSLLAQKQSGSVGSEFFTKVIYPNSYRTLWKYPSEEISNFSTEEKATSGIEMKSDLKTDKFIGVAFEKNN